MVEVRLPKCRLFFTQQEIESLLKRDPELWEAALRRGRNLRPRMAGPRKRHSVASVQDTCPPGPGDRVLGWIPILRSFNRSSSLLPSRSSTSTSFTETSSASAICSGVRPRENWSVLTFLCSEIREQTSCASPFEIPTRSAISRSLHPSRCSHHIRASRLRCCPPGMAALRDVLASAGGKHGKEAWHMLSIVVGAFCWFAAGMLLSDAMATLVIALRYHRRRREVPERCDGKTCN